MSSLWLMYHDVYEGPAASEIPRSAGLYHVSAERFRSHLHTVELSGLPVVTVGDFLSGRSGSENSLVLTFDDGWRGAFENAMPLLLQRGWRATFFVTRNFVGREKFCGVATLREAVAHGMEVGIHGTTHRMLSSCSHAEVVEEFRACREFLESLLGEPVRHASIPGGDLTADVVSAAQEAGVASLSNSRPGLNVPMSPRFDLRRLAVKSSTSDADMRRFCRFDLRRERVRWATLQMPRAVLGMRRYSQLRRLLLGEHDRHGAEVFRP